MSDYCLLSDIVRSLVKCVRGARMRTSSQKGGFRRAFCLVPISYGKEFCPVKSSLRHRSGIDQMSHFLSIPNVFVSAIFRLITNCTREITQPESTNCSRNGTCHADVYCLRESTNWTRNTFGKRNAHFLLEKR